MCLNSVKNSLSHPLFLSLSLTHFRSLSPPSLSVSARLTIVAIQSAALHKIIIIIYKLNVRSYHAHTVNV